MRWKLNMMNAAGQIMAMPTPKCFGEIVMIWRQWLPISKISKARLITSPIAKTVRVLSPNPFNTKLAISCPNNTATTPAAVKRQLFDTKYFNPLQFLKTQWFYCTAKKQSLKWYSLDSTIIQFRILKNILKTPNHRINDFCVVMVVQRNGKMISVHLHFLGQSTTLHMWLRQHSW